MSYSLLKSIQGDSGLTTVEYQIVSSAGAIVTPWTGTGVIEVPGLGGQSTYLAIITVSDGFVGVIQWIDNQATPVAYGTDDIYPELKEDIDTIITNLTTTIGYLDTEIADIKEKTDLIPAAPAAVGDIPTVVEIRTEMDANSTKLVNLDASVASRADQTTVNAISAYVDTLETSLSNATSGLAALNTDLDNIITTLSTINTNTDTIETSLGSATSGLAALNTDLDGIITTLAAVKLKTDNLPADPAGVTDIPTAVQIRVEMDNNSSKLSDLLALLTTASGYIDTEIAAIKAKTDNLPANPAATTDVPTTNIQSILDMLQQWIKNRAIFTEESETYYEDNGTTVAFTQTITKTGVQAERGAAVE
jgi:uncharacterized phage infection (PIP) family protein YhgE